MIRVELKLSNLLLFAGLAVLIWAGYLVRDVIVLLGIALMLMATLHPLVALAERRGLSHSWAVTLVMLSLVIVPSAMLAALAPFAISEIQGLAKNVPSIQHRLNDLLQHVGAATAVDQAIAKANLRGRIGDIALVSVREAVTVLTQALTVFVIAGYLLADNRRIQYVLHELLPRRAERHIEPLLLGMERVVGGYIRGQLLTSVLFGGYAVILCLALGVPDPLLMGIVAALGDVIPLFGVPVAAAITVVVAFTHSVWQPIGVVIGYVIYSQLESHILMPRIYARTVNLAPLLVIVATILGAALDGVLGILIGIPIVGALKVVFDYVIAEQRQGRESAIQEMAAEPADRIAQQEEDAEGVDADMAEAVETHEGIPPPSYSPFEPVPEPGAPPRVRRRRKLRMRRV